MMDLLFPETLKRELTTEEYAQELAHSQEMYEKTLRLTKYLLMAIVIVYTVYALAK